MNEQRKYQTEVTEIIMILDLVAPILTTTFFMVDFLRTSFLVVSIPSQLLVLDHHQKKPLQWLVFPLLLVFLVPGLRSLATINLVQIPMDVLVPLRSHHLCFLVLRSHSSHLLVSTSWTSQHFDHFLIVVLRQLIEWTNFH